MLSVLSYAFATLICNRVLLTVTIKKYSSKNVVDRSTMIRVILGIYSPLRVPWVNRIDCGHSFCRRVLVLIGIASGPCPRVVIGVGSSCPGSSQCCLAAMRGYRRFGCVLRLSTTLGDGVLCPSASESNTQIL